MLLHSHMPTYEVNPEFLLRYLCKKHTIHCFYINAIITFEAGYLRTCETVFLKKLVFAFFSQNHENGLSLVLVLTPSILSGHNPKQFEHVSPTSGPIY